MMNILDQIILNIQEEMKMRIWNSSGKCEKSYQTSNTGNPT